MKDRLIVALDVSSLKKAEALVKKLYPHVKIFKVGSELFTSCGPEAIRMIHKKGAKVFLDMKFHDIPNTVASAIKAAKDMGVFMVNVHASGGEEMMKAAVAARGVGRPAHPGLTGAGGQPIILAVTVLTSLDSKGLKRVGVKSPACRQAELLAELAKSSGLDGVVCSPAEIKVIRKRCGKDFIIVTPGIRATSAEKQDQKRISTPEKAISDGADYIVVGRPITEAKDPLIAAKEIIAKL